MLFLSLKNASGFCGKENEVKRERGGVKGRKKRGKEKELSQNPPKGESQSEFTPQATENQLDYLPNYVEYLKMSHS